MKLQGGDRAGVRPATSADLADATGCIAGRLLRVLDEQGERARWLKTRRPEGVARPQLDDERAATSSSSLEPEMRGVSARYLFHSMTSAASSEQQDRRRVGKLRCRGARGGSAGSSTWAPEEIPSRIIETPGVQTIGRRDPLDPESPAVGSALGFWRAEAYEPDRLLRPTPTV
jgi:hypothetical protein